MALKPIDLVKNNMSEYKVKDNEINVKVCPFCRPQKNDNLWKFYINRDTGAFDCKRAKKCGASGSFYDLAKYFNQEDKVEIDDNYKTEKKKYKKPDVELEPITDKKILKYLKLRGFDKNTIEECNIKQKEHYKSNIIAFEYYYNDNLTFIKYRNLKKKNNGRQYWREKNTKPILWNMNNINTDKPVLICEGEFDAMACIQAGYKNTVSIPSGSEDFAWVDNCWKFLKEVDEFIIWPDNDKAGKKFKDAVVTKIGEEKCKVVEMDGNINDANELLYKKGEEKVLSKIKSADKAPIEGIIRVAEVEYFDMTDIEAVKTGFKELDKYLKGFAMGEISIWTGENESGKSTLLGQMLIEAIDQNYNVCAFSGELPKYIFRNWVERQLASERYILRYQEDDGENYVVPKEIKEYMGKWFYDKLFLYDADKTRVDADIVLEKFKQSAKRYNCKVFLIDNLIKMNLGKSSSDYYRAQSKFIDKCSVFAHKYNCHLHIVAHPRKTKDDISKVSISGSGDITNLADRVLAVKNTSKDQNKSHDGEIGILKDRMFGNSGNKVNLYFRNIDLRYAESNNPIQFDKKYGWENEYEKEEGD